jgi:hypothetical protein
VAVGAIDAELPLVRILAMAVGAARKRDFLQLAARMTLPAFDRAVLAAQRKARPLVIEGGLLPGIETVTTLAIGPQSGTVGIGVTIQAAGKGEVLPPLVRVASLADDPPMRSAERESGSLVIELEIAEGRLDRMTALAVGSQLPAVRVGVAGETSGVVQEKGRALQPSRRERRAVALAALGDPEVHPQEWIARLAMIELA